MTMASVGLCGEQSLGRGRGGGGFTDRGRVRAVVWDGWCGMGGVGGRTDGWMDGWMGG